MTLKLNKMTKGDLVKLLSKYDDDTIVWSGYESDKEKFNSDIKIFERSIPFDRDREDEVALCIGFEKVEIVKDLIEIPVEDLVEEIYSNVTNRTATEREVEGIKFGIGLACHHIDYTKYKLRQEILMEELKTL
jgi:hypothetical protein